MAAVRLAAAQQLMKAMAAVNKEAWSGAELVQLHTDSLPAARHLAPTAGDAPHVVPLKPSEIKVPGDTPLAAQVLTCLVWVLRGLQEQHFTVDRALTQQACELACTLADVLHFIYVPDVSRPSSSRTQRGKATSLGRFLKLEHAERMIYTLADTARELNQHVFQQAASAPYELLAMAALCCDRIARMLLEWRLELAQGTSGHLDQCYMLLRWCTDSKLLCQLAEGCLLVLAMDPAPYMARGPPGLEELAGMIIMTMNGANHIQGLVLGCLGWFEELQDERGEVYLQVGQQGTGSDGTTPAPFLRLMLLYLAICQHWRRSVGLPTGSVRNQPRVNPADAAAVRAAVQQQLTPSCSSQLVQRVAAAYWAVVTVQKVPKEFYTVAVPVREDLAAGIISQWLRAMAAMADMYEAGKTCWALGAEELQLVMECAELDAATTDEPVVLWSTLESALRACPYPALVEFNRQHSRTLLTLAERSFEAALAATAAAAGPNGAGSSSGSSSRGAQAEDEGEMSPLFATSDLAGCLARCLYGNDQGGYFAIGKGTLEAADYPADATWALLDASTGPRLLRLMETLLRIPGGTGRPGRHLHMVLPCHLPEMQLYYSSPSTTRAVLCAVTTLGKWLQASMMALAMLLRHPTDTAAAAAATAAAVPGAVGALMSECVSDPYNFWGGTLCIAITLVDVAARNMGRAALLLDPVSYKDKAAGAALAAIFGPAGRSSRAWLLETAVQAGQQPVMASSGEQLPQDLADYKAQLVASPQPLEGVAKQLQPVFQAQQQAAAARQAAQLAKVHGKDTAAIAEQLQALQLGASGSSSGTGRPGAAAAAAEGGTNAADTSIAGGGSSSMGSLAAGAPPVTADDVTVAANALLVACKAAGALLGAPQLLEASIKTSIAHKLVPTDCTHLAQFKADGWQLTSDLQDLAEWLVLLHPLLVQLLPSEQGQVLVGLQGRLTSSNSSSSSGKIKGQGNRKKLSDEEVTDVLGALQHVVIPGQPGCSNPRCYCLEGVSEAAMKTQVCVACRGARYCSAACQRAHWKAGHKEVCKAVQAAAKAAAEAAAASSAEQDG